MSKGLKFDKGKQEWYRLPLIVLRPLADVYCNPKAGGKYPAFNCLLPFEDGDRRLWDAMMRHAEASQIDPLAINEEDGGVYHLAQLAFSALTRLHNALQAKEAA
jgi:hypothetical protein